MDGWNTILSFWKGLFSGAFAVSFRECAFLKFWISNDPIPSNQEFHFHSWPIPKLSGWWVGCLRSASKNVEVKMPIRHEWWDTKWHTIEGNCWYSQTPCVPANTIQPMLFHDSKFARIRISTITIHSLQYRHDLGVDYNYKSILWNLNANTYKRNQNVYYMSG